MSAAKTCGCACECSARATTTDDAGVPMCDECASYYTTDDGDVVCARQQGEDTCRHCRGSIQWGRIMTGASGAANRRDGRCACREWSQTERGDEWVLREVTP